MWWRTSFGDEELQQLANSLAHEHVSQGPITAEFEAKFANALGVPYAVATTSGSVALLMSLMALGVGQNDEVIVPNRTFVATAHAAVMVGATVVLVDVESDAPNIDIEQVKKRITPRTKAIMPVHLNGRASDMDGLNQIADEHGLYVIEDACQALFSRDSSGYLGTRSHVGCFSLGITKLISTGQGGVVVTRDEKIFERLILVRNHGVPDTFAGTYQQSGFNFKFTDLMASIGIVQLDRVADRITHVNRVYERYVSGINQLETPNLKLIPVDTAAGEISLYIEILCSEREALMEFLDARGIQTRPFHPDLHLSPHLGNTGEFPQSKPFGEKGLFLPCGPDQPLENIDRVIEALGEFQGSIH